MKLSVVTPVYNESGSEERAAKAVSSLANENTLQEQSRLLAASRRVVPQGGGLLPER